MTLTAETEKLVFVLQEGLKEAHLSLLADHQNWLKETLGAEPQEA